MKKALVMALAIGLVLSPMTVFCEEEDKVLELRMELALERVARLTAQLNLLKLQFIDGQKALGQAQKELENLEEANGGKANKIQTESE